MITAETPTTPMPETRTYDQTGVITDAPEPLTIDGQPTTVLTLTTGAGDQDILVRNPPQLHAGDIIHVTGNANHSEFLGQHFCTVTAENITIIEKH